MRIRSSWTWPLVAVTVAVILALAAGVIAGVVGWDEALRIGAVLVTGG
ncbi:hypothetical protein [Roseospira visakhapatnamensis]|uniref:Uncharacterized protein n=1 Tax=Roseospira visakhapatnamensis TaxID=390880 RepID=A0A7W6RGZ9_9PROT|nr:hypothetical protein [Roseospira visakhapatnamensis]MBB4268170.1 hypothetical protein [Roseospira visakhapatnamensis]